MTPDGRRSVVQALGQFWLDLPLRLKGGAVIAGSLVALLAAPVVFWASLATERRADDAVAHTLEVKVALSDVLKLLVDAETAARGFLLSGDRVFMQPYDAAVSKLPTEVARLRELAAGDRGQLAAVDDLQALTRTRFGLLETLLATPGAPLDEMLAGKRSMDEIRALVQQIELTQDARLSQERNTTNGARRATLIRLAVTAGVGGGLGILVMFLFVDGLVSRLRALSRNASRLERSEPMQPMPKAGDELGQLSARLVAASELQQEHQQEITWTRDELEQFFSLSLDMLSIIGVDGMLKRVNPVWQESLGWSSAELVERPYLDLVHPDDRSATIAEAERLAAGARTIGFENRYRARDGSYRWMNWKVAPNQKGDLLYAATRDVTDQKAAELSIRQARLEAERANRAKSEFLSRMSHELRTPLNAILGFAQLFEADQLNVEQRENVRHIMNGGRHLLELINEVIDISRIETGELALSPESVDVEEIVTAAVAMIRPLADQRGLGVTVQPVPSPPPYVRADRQRLRQVLLNLLSNAVKYNHADGTITVTVSDGAEGRVRISVADTGPGIPAALLPALFEPFERLGAENTAVEGTGLGLALSKKLCQAMDGSLGLDSVVDVGSTFWVEFGRSAGEIVPTRSAIAESQPGPGAEVPSLAATIVYIEDNAANVRLIERVMARRPGLTLLHALDGDTGIQLVRERRPALVLLDLQLPGMPGTEVLRRLWADPVTRAVPIVILTADATPGLFARLTAAGAARCLTKPLDIPNLMRTLDELLVQRGD